MMSKERDASSELSNILSKMVIFWNPRTFCGIELKTFNLEKYVLEMMGYFDF